MKKNIITILICIFGYFTSSGQTQILSVAAGTDFSITAGTQLSAQNLGLIPSANYTLNGISLTGTSTIGNASTYTNINKAYKFSGTTAAFSGVLKIGYTDAELNGMAEDNLKLLFHNGISWQLDGGSTNNSASNFELSSDLNVAGLNELTVGFCQAPNAPTVSGTSICSGSTAVLAAAGTGVLKWYDAATGGNLLYTGNSYTTAALTNNTTYYVEAFTCAPSQTRTAVVVTVNSSEILTQPSNASVCKQIGGTAALSVVAGSPTATYQWYTQTATSSTAWTLVTNNSNYAGAETATLNITRSSAIIPATGTKYKVVTTSSCGVATSNVVSITDFTVLSKATAIAAVTVLSPALTTCTGNSVQLQIAAGSIGNIQWQSSTDNVNWTNEGTAYQQTVLSAINPIVRFNTPALTQSTWFRVEASNGPCSVARSTAVFKITVSTAVVAGTIEGGGVSVCKFTAATTTVPAVTNSTTLTLNDYSGATFVWKKSTTLNGTYTAIAGATTPSYTALNLTATTYYKVLVTNGACSVLSDAAVINVNATSVAGIITASPAKVCYNTATTLTLGATHLGTVQWQSATALAGPFTDIENATATVLNTAALTATTYYRAVVTNNVCSPKTTLITTVLVSPQPRAGTIAQSNALVCPGTNTTTLTLTGQSGTVKWQSSPDSNFTTVTALTGTTTTYTAVNLAATTYFRAVVSSGAANCTPAFSDPVVINVATPINAGLIFGNATVCSGTATRLTAADFEAESTVQWQKSATLTGVYANVTTGTGMTSPVYTTPALTATTYFRALITKNGCSAATAGYAVLVQKAVAGTITGGTTATTKVCLGTPVTLTSASSAGNTFQWKSAAASTGIYTDIDGATSSTYQASTLVGGTKYYKVSVSYSGCSPLLSPPANVAVDATCNAFKMAATITSEFEAVAYPNPFDQNFTLDLTTSSEQTVEVNVYDMIGRLVESRKLSTLSEVAAQEIGNNYSSGVYNVIVTQGGNAKTLRVIKK